MAEQSLYPSWYEYVSYAEVYLHPYERDAYVNGMEIVKAMEFKNYKKH